MAFDNFIRARETDSRIKIPRGCAFKCDALNRRDTLLTAACTSNIGRSAEIQRF